MFSGHVLVVTLQFIPELIPLFIALRHLRDLGQFVHDGVHLRLHRLFQVAVDLFALVVLQHSGQRLHLLCNGRAVAQTCFHLPDEPSHGLRCLVPNLLIGQVFLLIEGQ